MPTVTLRLTLARAPRVGCPEMLEGGAYVIGTADDCVGLTVSIGCEALRAMA
jgi:hypothetical protein